MSDLTITVIAGKKGWEVKVSSDITFGDLRTQIEEKEGTVAGGLRLICKGRSHPDHLKLSEVGVSTGSKMMVMRTSKQKEQEKEQEKRTKLQSDYKSLSELRAQSSVISKPSTDAGASSSNAKPVVREIGVLGDPQQDCVTSVILIQGKNKYRVNIEMTESVVVLKQKAAFIDGINSKASNMRLLFKGKFLKDECNLSEYGVKDGSSLMLLFNAKHHDAKDDFIEMGSIKKKLDELEAKTRSVASQAEHRLLDSVDLAVKKSELQDIFTRLRDNLSSVRSEDERRASMECQLDVVEELISRL
ncbi:hypothetical protein BWQ96_01202 [Gracilariopsis chorda]|uniref:Ubiquitin-like domain-containing protein n=1 Tax=Gracilariopsis chorda TaxID=448386 RepID=A0A2V3J3W0_9FLOR|nr:hypothetical protein BWQ96_01202 [Gracilariopsis chorda]|eukprot:PXF49064.1 hypothetical protein BWQ96_01202 [Gracilariopsis chorda]